jgi:uncharacterized membrane protein YfcA
LNAELLMFCALVVVTGAAVGVLGGLLGIGGGLVLMPVLFELIQHLGADADTAVRSAIATSLATVIVTGARSSLSHHRRGSLDMQHVSAWAPGIVIGAMLGAEVANRIDTSLLLTAFAVLTVLLAVNMAFGRSEWDSKGTPGSASRLAGGGFVGMVSAMLGVGVAGLGVPLMTLFSVPVRQAVAAAALMGAMAAVPAAMRFVLGGWGSPDLAPWSFGYVNLLGFTLIVSMTLMTAPLGVALAHRCSQVAVKRVFATFLGVNAVRMLVF